MQTIDALQRLIAPGLVLALLMNSFTYAQQPSPPEATNASAQTTQTAPPQSDSGNAAVPPDTGANVGQAIDEKLPDSPSSVQRPTEQPSAGQSSQVPESQPSQAQAASPAQAPPRQPLGTAAAESVPTSGIAASRPAGAALAPAKQRRVRSILIKVGALAGVGAAIGATMALSKGSPSKPPGTN